MPSTSAGSMPASARAALEASAASCSSLRPEFLENSVWPMPAIAAYLVMRTACARAKYRNRTSATGGRETHLHGKPVAYGARLDLHQIGDEADALLEFDERHDGSFREPHRCRMPRNHPAVHGAAAAQLHDLAPRAVTGRAHRPRRVREARTIRAALTEQLPARGALPEEGGVGREHRIRPSRSGGRLPLARAHALRSVIAAAAAGAGAGAGAAAAAGA